MNLRMVKNKNRILRFIGFKIGEILLFIFLGYATWWSGGWSGGWFGDNDDVGLRIASGAMIVTLIVLSAILFWYVGKEWVKLNWKWAK